MYVLNPNNMYIYFKLLHIIYLFICLFISLVIYSLFVYLLPYVLDFVQMLYYLYFAVPW